MIRINSKEAKRRLKSIYQYLLELDVKSINPGRYSKITHALEAIEKYIDKPIKVDVNFDYSDPAYNDKAGPTTLISKRNECRRLLVKPAISPYDCVIEWLISRGCTGTVVDYIPSLYEIQRKQIDTVVGNLPALLNKHLTESNVEVFCTDVKPPDGLIISELTTLEDLNNMDFNIYINRSFVNFFPCSLGDRGMIVN